MRTTHLLFLLATALLLTGLGGCASKRVTGVHPGPVGQEGRVIEHRVLPGETLPRIADNYFGDPGRAEQIARENLLSGTAGLTEGSLLVLKFAPEEWDQASRRAAALGPYNKGVDLLAQERLAEAGRQFQLALDTAPGLLAARYNLALVHMRRGQNDRALALLEDLTEQRPQDGDFRFARASALFALTRYAEAEKHFKLVLEGDPEHSRAQFGLARSLQEGQKNRQAIQAWRRYLELDDSSSWATTARRNLRKLGAG
jgi:tetratricopeptide (TPR) repeat protein